MGLMVLKGPCCAVTNVFVWKILLWSLSCVQITFESSNDTQFCVSPQLTVVNSGHGRVHVWLCCNIFFVPLIRCLEQLKSLHSIRCRFQADHSTSDRRSSLPSYAVVVFLMCRRQLLLAAKTCSRAIQHSQACGQLQLGPQSLSTQLHTAALHAAASAAPLAQIQLESRVESSFKSSAVQQYAHGGLQQSHQQWAAARWFSTSLQTRSEEDLRVV